jgi:multicomponent Na+:H+ antiporter subunit D
VCSIIGALSISSFPLTSGFTTKALISEAALAEGLAVIYFLLAAASAGVFLHAGIKFPWFVFFQKDSGLRPNDAPWNMALAMVLFALICIGLGVYPQPFYALLPYPVEYNAYSPGKVLFYLQLLLFSGLAFFLLLPAMKCTLTVTLDTDWLWRIFFGRLANTWLLISTAIKETISSNAGRGLYKMQAWTQRHWGVGGVFARSWPIGTTAIWISVLLSAYVLLYYI